MERLRVVVGAVLSTYPFSPGMAWNWMQFADGLRELGNEVLFVEEVETDWLVDALGRAVPFEQSVNARHFHETTTRFGLAGSACLLLRGTKRTAGLAYEQAVAWAQTADIVVNMSGHIQSEELLGAPTLRAYVDQDPVYTQLWAARYGKDLGFARHDIHFTVGLNIGTRRSDIPDCGIHWRHLLPVLSMGRWPVTPGPQDGHLTTIASWSGYGDLEYEGRWYRSKYEEFRRFAELPRHTGQRLEVALKGFQPDDEGVNLLRDHGWQVELSEGAADLDSYQGFIGASKAEIGIAKNAYVQGRSGWFSDRSAHYLASGRPVIAQSTGFEDTLPTGEGLLAFSTMDEALEGIEAVDSSYQWHCRRAREFAETYLDHRVVLPAFIDACSNHRGVPSIPARRDG